MKKFFMLGLSMSLLILLSSFTVLQANQKSTNLKSLSAAKASIAFDDMSFGYFDDSSGNHYHVFVDNFGNVTQLWITDIFFNDVSDVLTSGTYSFNGSGYTISVRYNSGNDFYEGGTYRGPF